MDSLILHKGHVTHIIDPSSFWMRMGTDADFQEFDDYQNTLNKYYNETGRTDNVSADTLTQGDCVVVAESGQRQISDDDDEVNTDFHWNRARVSRMDVDKVDVFYIDLGYTEIVHMSRVKNVNRELFDYFPSQVIQLRLAGIRPLARSWTSRALNMFESRVLDQEVLVSLIDYDEVSKYGQVVIYTQQSPCKWRCVTHEMLDEDLGLPLAPMPEEFLSQEVVLAALARGEQDSSRSSCGLDNSRNDSAGGVLNETESRKNLLVPDPGQSVPDPGQSVSSLEAGQRLTPDSFSTSTSPDHSSASCESAAALVPAFDLSSLVRTKSLSVAKMQEDKVEEQRLLTRARLQQELEDSEEEEDGDEQEIDWGKSDLLIGEAGVFSDFDCIRQEIYKHHSDHRRDDDLNDFFYNVTGIHNATPLANSSVVEEHKGKEDTQRGSSEKDLKPLTEMEDYAIEKKIEEILLGKDSGELNMVCVLINSIIEPDVTVPCDRLVAVFTAIIETVVRNPDVDPLIAFGALETYLGTPAFDIALETVLKSLRSSFVKMSRKTQRSNCHRAFTEFLVMLFIRAGNWPLCSCSLVHEFVMASLERWVVFNKQRMQNSDSSMDVEQIYLKCVEVLIDGAGERLHQNCPDRYCLLLEEIKHKLLHDSTQRIIREQLLNILLKLHTQVTWSTPKTTSERRGVGVQTEACLDHSSTKDSEGSAKTHVAVEEDMKTANDVDSYVLEEDCLNTYGCSDMSSSGWSDEDSDAGTRSLSSADTILAIHSLKRADSIPDMNSLASVAGCDIADFDSKTSSAPVAYGASSHSLLTTGNNTRLPRAVQRVPPHVQRNISQDHSFKNEITAVGRSDDSQQKASNELNAFVGELTFSASQNALEQKGKKPVEFGRSLEAHVTKGDRHDLNDSKLLGGNTLKQTSVQRLNISAPEFTPKISGSWAQLDQVKMSACSIDVPEYESDTGLVSVKPSGGTNSELIKPINRDMENETTVRNIEEGLLFVEVGNEKGLGQQKDVSGNIDEIDTSGNIDEIDTSGNIDEIDTSVARYFSDLEALSEHGSPSPENAVESVEMNILDNRIKYTAQELKALNMGASAHLIDADLPRKSSLADTVVQKADNQSDKQPAAELIDVDLPRESSLVDTVVQKANNQSDKQPAEDLTSSPSAIPCLRYTGRGGSPLEISVGPKSNSAKWKSLSELLPPSCLKPRPHTVEQPAEDLTSSPSAIPCLRYTGRGGSPLEISVGPKSNSAKWKSLSELLPPSCLKPHPHTLETSAPPGPFSCETIGNGVLHATEKVDPNSLYSHAQGVFPIKDQSVPEKTYMGCDEMNTVSNAVPGDTLGKEDVNSSDNDEATIVRGLHDVTHDVPRWPETFFRSVGAVEDTPQFTSADVSSNQTGKSKAKKKMKFRPASEVLAGKSDHDYDEKAAAVSDVNDKECRNEIEESEVGGHVIHQPKLGALCSISSKRSSWSAELRQEKPRSDNSCSLVHEFVMASLERWVVFNKQRMQNSDSSMDVEQIYLKCVEVLIDGAGERLHQNCPDRYCLLLEEIKHKLLHDSTQRIIREQLLNILLKLHTQVTWSTPKTTSERRGVGVQTEACLDHSSTKDSEGSAKTHVAVEEDMKTANDVDSYVLEEDCLNTYGCSDMSSSGWSDEDSDAGTRSLSSADTILAIHSLKRADSIPDMNSLASVAGCDIADFDSKTSSAPVAYGASSHSLLTTGNNTRLPRAVQRVPPHVQRNISQDHSFKNEITAVGRSDDSQQKASNELNAFVGELTFSASQNALEQKGKKPVEFGRSLEAHVTKGDRHDLNDSKLLGGNTLKQTSVQRLNISAPEFTPKISGSWAQLDQVKMSACSIDVPEYESDTGLVSVKPSGGTNSELIKPINRDMENETTVRNIEEGLLFVEVGNEKGLGQQKDVSGNIDEIDTSGNIDEIDTSGNIDEIDTSVARYFSDLEALSEHGSPSPENAVESVEMNILDNRIKYTAQELKALNMGASAHLIDADLPRKSSLADTVVQKADNQSDKQPAAELIDVDLPRESSLVDTVVQKANNQSDKQPAEDLTSSPSAIPCLRYTGRGGSPLEISVGPKSNSAKWKSLSELLPPSCLKPRPHTVEQPAEDLTSSPSAIPCLRYTGRGGSPLEISVGPKSNSAKWKSLSELLPPSCLKPHPHTLETSAPPGPFSCETIGNGVLHATEKVDPNSLYSHAQGVFPIKDQSVPEKTYMGCDEMNTVSNAVPGDTLGKEDVNSSDNDEATIVRGLHDVTHDVPRWPETFFRSVGAVEDTPQFTSADVSSNQTGKSKAKKKMKFRPASEVLAGKSDHDYDEKAAAVSDVNDKECRNEIEESEVGGHVIHQPKLGALCSISSKRSSWSAELRQEKPRSDKWVPGRRKCTRCGSTDHTIYDCTQEDPYRKPSNQIYFM